MSCKDVHRVVVNKPGWVCGEDFSHDGVRCRKRIERKRCPDAPKGYSKSFHINHPFFVYCNVYYNMYYKEYTIFLKIIKEIVKNGNFYHIFFHTPIDFLKKL